MNTISYQKSNTEMRAWYLFKGEKKSTHVAENFEKMKSLGPFKVKIAVTL